MREIVRDGIHWVVREIDATRIPGAHGRRCLIFESDGVVRRAWNFDRAWEQASDDTLWALIDAPGGTAPSGNTGEHAISAAIVVAERARLLLQQVELIRGANQPTPPEQTERSEQCRRLRAEMRKAIARYAEALRADGVPPERALVLLKAALKDGLGTCSDPGDATAEQLLHDGVDWAIDAYYAA